MSYLTKILRTASYFRKKLAELSPEDKITKSSFFSQLKDWSTSNGITAININVLNNKFVEVKFNDGKVLPEKQKDFQSKFEKLILLTIQPFEGWISLEM